MSLIIKFLAGFLLVYLSVLILFYFLQEKLILQPKQLDQNYIFQFDHPHEALTFEKDAVTISALYFKSQEKAKGLIFYCHGNAGNIQRYGDRALNFTKKGYDVFMWDYRGYGKSRGAVSEAGMHEDAVWLYQLCLKQYGFTEEELIIYGRSLGTGVAARLATKQQARVVLLETPYYNIADIARSYFPFAPYHALLHFQFRTDQCFSDIQQPVTIFHGTNDWIVPYSSGKKLIPLFKETDEFITIEKGKHNNLYTFDCYQEALEEALNKEL